jgi:hypothetical protein
MFRFHCILTAALCPFIAVAAVAGLVDYQHVDRSVSAYIGASGGTFQDTQPGYWYSTIEQGNASSIVRAHQQSDLAINSLSFMSDTQASGTPFQGERYSGSMLNTTLSLDSDAVVDLHWTYLLELEGSSSGGAGMSISSTDGGSLFDIDLQFEGELSASSEMELVAGSYLIEMYLDSSVEPSGVGEAVTAFEVSMIFSSVPAPGALGLLAAAILAGRTRRRSSHRR